MHRLCDLTLGKGFVNTDDCASDLISKLWENGGFQWENGRIIAFVRKSIRYEIHAYQTRKAINQCEFGEESYSRKEFPHHTDPTQETDYDAKLARRLLLALPAAERNALSILADGGTPIDVSREMRLSAWDAIHLIKRAREYVSRIDPAK